MLARPPKEVNAKKSKKSRRASKSQLERSLENLPNSEGARKNRKACWFAKKHDSEHE